MTDSPHRSRLVAVLGPTNTGKTHLAVERMLGHSSGMIGLPLRLLAREIFDRTVKAKGAARVALITGEEKIVPAHPQYFVCTVEAMPLERRVEFLAVDEIQLCADPERGHVFTHRLLHARGASETMLMGATTVVPLVRRLCPDAEIQFRERLSTLSYAGPKKLTRLPRRSAVVAFSAEAVYAIAELIRRHRGGAAVVMGSLSPRTRNAQVALFQSGEVDFLVATDAIGMGLNMDVDHVAFAGLRKFDGRRTRGLYSHEIAQIAGRAGRFRRDGAFGVTGDAPDLDPDVVGSVEGHSFPPVLAAEWRNARLDFDSLHGLMRSLAEPPPRPGLRLSEEAQDETTLRQLSSEPTVIRRARDRANLRRLWEACQTPDFRKTTQEEHTRLIGGLFEHLTQGNRRVPDEWMQGQFSALDRADGDIEALSMRLARVRTLAYIANRADWLADPPAWQGRARDLEDRLSDTLHQSLMQRFVDRRTSTLLRSLHQRAGPILSGIGADGAVMVEGHVVGRLSGVHFEPERGASDLENRALRGAVERAVAPEIARRLGELASESDEAFALGAGGVVVWRGLATGEIVGGAPFKPRVRLLGEFGHDAVRERAARRLEAFVAGEASRRLAALKRLTEAIADGRLKGLARGVAYQLVEQFGVLDRRRADEHVRALSRQERRVLRSFGVRFGAFSLYLPELLTEETRTIGAPFAELAAPRFRPAADRLSVLPHPQPPPEALGLRGLRAVAGMAAPVLSLERLDALSREAAPERQGLIELTPALLAALGWEPGEAVQILRGLGFVRVRSSDPAETSLWRRRRMAPRILPREAGESLSRAKRGRDPATPGSSTGPSPGTGDSQGGAAPSAAAELRGRGGPSFARRARRRARRRAAAGSAG
ncbi:MAG TPA: helicase-related protein [Roseiarcus sp.]|jgi:ATP-dependent RNA helicase SUPV3L1/SUV3|nr:helicase-related protein [Roseiarcus sp.]